MTFDPADCKLSAVDIEPIGGQHAGLRSRKVRVVHEPTGLAAEVEARSQHRSRQIALEMIEYGLTFQKEFV